MTRRGEHPVGRAARAAVRAAAALAVLAVAIGGAGPAAAQAPAGRLQLLSVTPFVGPTSRLDLEVAVRGSAGADPSLTVERYDDVSNSYDPRRQLDDWLAGRGNTSRSFDKPLRFALGDPAGTEIAIPLSPDPASSRPDGFTITDAGVFPLVLTLWSGPQRLDEVRTFLIRLPSNAAGAPPLRVAPVLGLRAPVALKPDGTRSLSSAERDRLARAQALLKTYPTAPFTIDPIPETVASLGGPGALTPQTLDGAIGSRPVLASTLVEIDVDRWIAAGLRDQLERQRQLADDALARYLPGTGLPDSGTWVVRHPLGARARAELQSLNAPPVTRLVVPAELTGPVDGRALGSIDRRDAELTPFQVEHPGGRMLAVPSDDRLAGRLTATGDPVADAQATLADLAVLACGSRTGPGTNHHCNTMPDLGRGVALVIPDDEEALGALDGVMRSLTTQPPPMLELTDLDGLFAIPPAGRSAETPVRPLLPGPTPPSLTDFARRLDGVATRTWAYRSMLVPPADPGDAAPSSTDLPATDRADRLLQLLDVAAAANTPNTPSNPGAYLDAVSSRLDAVFADVRATGHEPITLTSGDLDIQVRLQNDLDHPVTVEVQLTSDKPLFEGGRRSWVLTRQLPAAASASIRVPVQAVGSGTYPVDVRVLSPDRAVELATTRIEVRSTVVSLVGLGLTIAAGFFLLVWWARHFRDARRARKLVKVDEIDAAVAIATGEVPAVGNAGARRRV